MMYGPCFGYHNGLKHLYHLTKKVLAEKEGGKANIIPENALLCESRRFNGLSQHYDLAWSSIYIKVMVSGKRQKDFKWLKEKDDCKLRSCLNSLSGEKWLEEEF